MSSTYDSAKTLGVRRHLSNWRKALTFLRILIKISLTSGYIEKGIKTLRVLWIKGLNAF